jgi:hypothetical protein
MSEVYLSLYGDDAEQLRELRDRLDDELPGGVKSNADVVRAALDYAEEALGSE